MISKRDEMKIRFCEDLEQSMLFYMDAMYGHGQFHFGPGNVISWHRGKNFIHRNAGKKKLGKIYIYIHDIYLYTIYILN